MNNLNIWIVSLITSGVIAIYSKWWLAYVAVGYCAAIILESKRSKNVYPTPPQN